MPAPVSVTRTVASEAEVSTCTSMAPYFGVYRVAFESKFTEDLLDVRNPHRPTPAPRGRDRQPVLAFADRWGLRRRNDPLGSAPEAPIDTRTFAARHHRLGPTHWTRRGSLRGGLWLSAGTVVKRVLKGADALGVGLQAFAVRVVAKVVVGPLVQARVCSFQFLLFGE